MPKGEKKSSAWAGRAGNESCPSHGDFTLYEFANADLKKSPARSGRMKKSMVNGGVHKLLGQNLISKEKSEYLAWYDKDLSDYDNSDDDITVDVTEVDENGVPITKHSQERKRTNQTTDEGKTYPADVWYLISEYICPESVSTFALLCHDSHRVTHTVGFWQKLYQRCYNNEADLPHRLQPHCLARLHGLRSLVILSLFHTYSPFVKRLQNRAPMEADPDHLHGSRCLLMWYSKVKDLWHFYFKFRRPSKRLCWLRQHRRGDLLSANDVHDNPEEDCCVLQVILQHFVSVPPCIMGQVLVQSGVSVGHGMRYHKLRLHFCAERIHGKGLMANGTSFCLDPVLNMNIKHWWHPNYPLHNYNNLTSQ